MRRQIPDLPACWPPAYPPHRPVTGDESRRLDAEAQSLYGVPSLVLMEHASRGVAAIAAALVAPRDRIVVLCGPGNNGGDGYGAARFLGSWGFTPRVLQCSRRPPAKADAAAEVRWSGLENAAEDAWADRDLLLRAVSEADLLVDALFGVGLDRDLDEPFPRWIHAMNAAAALRLAVDVPSGLDADTGHLRPVSVRADVTATMAMPKEGLVTHPSGALHAGRVVEVDIGLPGPLHRAYAV
jgi:hydroxyethylthiazole kinase-like uncharacterized protein yjeF